MKTTVGILALLLIAATAAASSWTPSTTYDVYGPAMTPAGVAAGYTGRFGPPMTVTNNSTGGMIGIGTPPFYFDRAWWSLQRTATTAIGWVAHVYAGPHDADGGGWGGYPGWDGVDLDILWKPWDGEVILREFHNGVLMCTYWLQAQP